MFVLVCICQPKIYDRMLTINYTCSGPEATYRKQLRTPFSICTVMYSCDGKHSFPFQRKDH